MVVKRIGLVQFSKDFSDEEMCKEYLKDIRWPLKIICPFCKSDGQPYLISGKWSKYAPYKCSNNKCGKKFNVFSNTIFQNKKISLSEWFYFIYSVALNRKNTSSIQNGKNNALTQKSMWQQMSSLREIYKQEDIVLSGVVEIDECFVSKKNGYINNYGGLSVFKGPVIGLFERGGKVIIKLIPDRTRDTIEAIIHKYVQKGATIYTDGHASYAKLSEDYIHDWVNHSTKEYVRNEVHTNGIESIWSYLKKCIRGAHHSVSEKHLQTYLDEVAYKFNTRLWSDVDRFNDMLERCLNVKKSPTIGCDIPVKTQKLVKAKKQSKIKKTVEKKIETLVQDKLPITKDDLINKIEEKVVGITEQDMKKLHHVKNHLVECAYESEKPLSIKELSVFATMSMSRLKYSFKTVYKTSIYDYYLKLRIERAYQLLSSKRYSVREVYKMLLVVNSTFFSNQFREVYGKSPSEYFKSIH